MLRWRLSRHLPGGWGCLLARRPQLQMRLRCKRPLLLRLPLVLQGCQEGWPGSLQERAWQRGWGRGWAAVHTQTGCCCGAARAHPGGPARMRGAPSTAVANSCALASCINQQLGKHTHTHEDQQTLTASRVVAHAATAPQPFSQLPQSFGRAHEQTLTHCHKHTHTPYHLLLLLLGKQPSYFLWHALHRGVYNRGGGKGRERGTWRPARAHLGMQG